MTRRRLVWIGVVVCLALAVGLGVRLASEPNRVSWENYERLQDGMSQEEVEAILGAPVGRWSGMVWFSGGRVYLPSKVWNVGGQEIQVTFHEGRLVHKDFMTIGKPSFRDRLRARLGW